MELKRELITSKEALEAKITSCTDALNKKFHGGDDMRHITVCGGTGCRSCKSRQVQDKLEEIVRAQGLEKDIKINGVGCFGLCVNGPIVLIYPQDAMYEKVSVDDLVNELLNDIKKKEN